MRLRRVCLHRIRRGVLANEREARFRGFDLAPEQRKIADGQPMGVAEGRHHDGIMFDMRAISERNEALRAEIAAKRASVKPGSAA